MSVEAVRMKKEGDGRKKKKTVYLIYNGVLDFSSLILLSY